MAMPKSKAGLGSPITHAKTNAYPYRQGFGMFPSAEFVSFFDDFVGSVSTNVPNGWTAAVIDTGATLTPLAVNTLPSGAIDITSDGVSEGVAIYLPRMVQLDNREFFMECRVYTQDADDTDVQFGLTSLTSTTNPEDLYTVTSSDLIAFGVLDGDATVTMVCDKDGSDPSNQLGSIDLSDFTWHTLGIHVTGNSTDSNMSVKGYVDGNLAVTWSDETTVPDDLVLAPFIAARTGGAASHNIYFDYVRFCAVR